MDALDVGRAHLVGNSMGGRVAIEMGLRAPERVAGLALLAPAVAFVKRDWHPIVRLMRPELGLLPHNLGRSPRRAPVLEPVRRSRPGRSQHGRRRRRRVPAHLRERRARGWPSSPRRATSTSSVPSGAAASTRAWPSSRRPSLFVWGACDRLIPPGFKRHVAQWLPDAEQIVLEDCGHVPQVERSEQTIGLLRRFFGRVDALGARRARARAA